MQQIVEKKQLAQLLCGGPSSYQSHKSLHQKTPYIYQDDFMIYTDDVSSRHQRNISQLNKIKSLIKDGTLLPSMLLPNTSNTYYASYILHHHYSYFVRALSNYIQIPTVRQIIQSSSNLTTIGAFFDNTLNPQTFKTDIFYPKINSQGFVEMPQNIYFYSSHTSLLITHCLFQIEGKNGKSLCLVRLRNNDGGFQPNVHIRDFGGTISNDYMNVGYNLNGSQPALIINLKSEVERSLTITKSVSLIDEFGLSLEDLRRSLSITVRYTSLRKQFPTLDGTKEERRIITYQAVGARILEGFGSFCAFTFLLNRLKNTPALSIFFTPLLQYSHHTILQRIIHLRECCGGFGYLQVSGHPGNIQRTAYRAAQKSNVEIPDNKQFLKRAHYYSGDDSLEPFFGEQIKSQKIFNFPQIFKVFVLICIQMRKRQSEFPKQIYIRQFVRQSAIQAIYNFDTYGRTEKVDTISLIIQYLISHYIIENAKFINWKYIKVQPEQYYEGIQKFHRQLILHFTSKIQQLQSTLELGYLRNVITGGSDENQFYQKLWQNSRNQNGRNLPQFQAYIKEPIIKMLTQNRKSSL